MLGSILLSSSLLLVKGMENIPNHRFITSLCRDPAWLRNLRRRCCSMEESAFTPISAFRGYVTKRLTSAKVENKENRALITSSVTRHSLAGLHPYGLMRHSASQWQMLDLSAWLSTIASQGISVGNWTRKAAESALRSTQLLMASSSFGTMRGFPLSLKHQCWLTDNTANQVLLLETLRTLILQSVLLSDKSRLQRRKKRMLREVMLNSHFHVTQMVIRCAITTKTVNFTSSSNANVVSLAISRT